MGVLQRGIGGLGRVLLDVLLPPQCLTCDAPVRDPGGFCQRCFAEVQFITDPCCTACGVAFSHAGEGGRYMTCAVCSDHPPLWRQARAALCYDARSKKIVLALKHGDRPEMATALGAMMARAGTALLGDADLLVPVPLHPSRLRARRYNQSALLARAVGRISSTAVAIDALVRLRPTQPLADFSAERRQAMVAGAFGVRRGRAEHLRGRRVVLIDDVLTSGATATACTRTLLAAGAASVDLLVAMRVHAGRAMLS